MRNKLISACKKGIVIMLTGNNGCEKINTPFKYKIYVL